MRSKSLELLQPETHISLPNSFENMLQTWPELTPLLEAFAQRDSGTFMHSAAVHFTASRLAQDLFLLTKPSYALQNEVYNRSPFWMLHDIGKTAAHNNQEFAQHLVHPKEQMNRPAYDRARHWLHPQMGGDLLTLWAKNTAPRLQPFIKKWAQLTCRHDRQLNPFLACDDTNISYADKLSQVIFALADTSMAMGLPRPNKNKIYSTSEIRQALQRKYLHDETLQKLFPGQNGNQLRHYIITSVLSSLQELGKNYPQSVWTAPTSFINPTFTVSVGDQSKKTNMLDTLIIQTWQEYEEQWDSIMIKMDRNGVF